MTAFDAIYARHATRSFTAEPIDEATIRDLLAAAVHAPTAMHLEPWAFVIVQDRALLQRISDRAKELALRAPDEPHRELARTPSAPRRAAQFADPAFNIFYDAGTLIVICGKPVGAFVAADCWLAAENVMIAATAMGLATCPIGFALAALADPAIKTELGIPADTTVFAPIIVGVPTAAAQPTTRREPLIWTWKK
ncbi:MAG TPA: nitroreductase family protein [Kofleriaceae bacterium]|nr:nitroreductase family protein [Kofleriaceae bacterium]